MLADDGEAVVVTVNYRVGALGFLDLSEFDSPGAGSTRTRFARVLAALRWVRDNIAAFGGDPDRVTLFGESGGAGIITRCSPARRPRDFFSAAIAQSSPATSVYEYAYPRHLGHSGCSTSW